MITRTLTAITASLPSSLKHRLAWARGAYTRVLAWKQPTCSVTTISGYTFQWRIDSLTHQQHIRGTPEPYMQEAYKHFVRPGMIVYDIGASVGFHSLLLATMGAKVYSFEPNPFSYPSLLRQIATNPELSIHPQPYALSDECGNTGLHTEWKSMAYTSMSYIADTGRTIIERRTLDSLDLPPPDLIKIDVEGHEVRVLKGGLEKLKLHRPIILCDYHDERTFPTVKELLEPIGYEVTYKPPICCLC
jgi:FkbM family methyltransferase